MVWLTCLGVGVMVHLIIVVHAVWRSDRVRASATFSCVCC
jgi:hypothetical protein